MYQPFLRHIFWNLCILLLLFCLGIITWVWAQEPSRTEPATVDVKATLAKDTRPLNPHFLGCNVNLTRGGSWKDIKLTEMAKQLCATIRYPAGSIANWWDWRAGWFYKDLKDLPQKHAKISPNIYTLADLKLVYQATGAEPIFDLNILTSDLDYQLDMLRTAAKLGLPIKWIELGNEFYLEQPKYSQQFATGGDYGKEASRWISAIKTAFPNAKVAAVGILPRANDRFERTANWNRSLLSELKGADAITLHWYPRGNQAHSPSAWNDMPEEDSKPDPTVAEVQNGFFQTSAGLTELLEQPFVNLAPRAEQANKEIPGNFEWWFTEYNLRNTSKVTAGTWAHGLFTATMTLTLLQLHRVELACVHSLVGGPYFSLTFGFTGHRDDARGVGFTASGHTVALLAAAMRGKTSAQRIEFLPNRTVRTSTVRTSKEQEYPSLVGWVFRDKENSQVVLMNLSGDTVRVTASGFVESGTPWVQLAADPRKVIHSDSDLNKIEGKFQGVIILPPYSLTKIGK